MPGKNKNREENYRPYEDEEQFEDLIMPEKGREEAAGKGGVISFLGKAVLTIHVCLAVLAGLFLYKSGYLPSAYLAAGGCFFRPKKKGRGFKPAPAPVRPSVL